MTKVPALTAKIINRLSLGAWPAPAAIDQFGRAELVVFGAAHDRRDPDDSQEIEMIEAAWGSDPRFSDGVTYEFIRAEGKRFPASRCLVAASKIHIRNGEKRYGVFREDGNFFYFGRDLGTSRRQLAG